MSAIVIKTEKDECEDEKTEIKEGGGVSSGTTTGGGGGTVVASVGLKAVVEKTQAALKVAKEAKKLNLRLKDTNLLMPQKQPEQASIVANKIAKRVSNTTVENLQNDNNDRTNLPFQVGHKQYRIQTTTRFENQTKTPTSPPVLQQSPSLKCGEIFVTNNARKWTFVCTYCQKTTRDIGEFVCHIKFKHMLEQYYEDEDCDGEEILNNQQGEHNEFYQDDCYDNNDQDYFDCTNYLDLNVHTEADELPNNGIKTKPNSKTMLQNNIKDAGKEQKNKIVDLGDKIDQNRNAKNSSKTKNELFDYDMEEEDDGVEIINDENNDVEGMDDDKLLFLRSSSIEDAVTENVVVGSKGGSKKYRSHVRGKAYCNLCDKTFQYYSLYRNHMIKHSNITPYKCEYCSKAFKSKQAIRYHMNTHTKEIQYTCPLCPMTYGTENQFITHVLNHESESCFPCMVCAKILKSDQDREEHLSTHTEERPFGCNYCNKRFRQKHHLSNHLKLHCQYRCDFCKSEFTSTQTQRRPYACASCEEYPEIRIQVEKQRSKSSNNSEINPLELTYEGGGTQDADNAECVDLATDDEDEEAESETSNSILGGSNRQNRVKCQYCTRAFKNSTALKYHMRQQHSHVWKEKK